MIEINKNPTRRQLRWFAGLVFPLFTGWLAWIAASQLHLPWVAHTLIGLGLVVAVVGLAFPTVARWVWLGTMYAVFPIGWVVSHVLLVIVYYGVLTPIGLAMRLAGHDPMTRDMSSEEKTYWKPPSPRGDIERYFRQY